MIEDPHQTKKLAKEEFEAWASHYDYSLLNRFLFRPSYYIIIEELARWQRATDQSFCLLDIGCGTGTLVSMIGKSNLQVSHLVGLDYAMEMCQQACSKASSEPSGEIRFTNGDSERLPFEDESFDIVSCANSFHHYPHQQKVVQEMRRVLRPGGQLMIVDGFRDNVIGWFVFDVIIGAVEKAVYHAPWTVMRSYFTEAGFGDISQRKYNFLFPSFLTSGKV